MKTILLAIDSSQYARYAMIAARSLAEDSEAQLIVFRAYESQDWAEGNTESEFRDHAGKVVSLTKSERETRQNLSSNLSNVGYRLEERTGYTSIWQEIIRQAQQASADLIVMGAYGTSGPQKQLGSNTSKVMQNADIPVLIVADQVEDFNVKDVVLAYSFYGPIYDVFPRVAKILDIYRPQLHLLKVVTPSNFIRSIDAHALMDEFARTYGYFKHIKDVYTDRTYEAGVVNFCKENRMDLVCVSTHERRSVSRLLAGNNDELSPVKGVLSIKLEQPPFDAMDYFIAEYDDLLENTL